MFLFGKTKLIGAQRFFQIIKVVSETFLFSLDFGIGIVHLQFNGIGLFLLSLFSGGFLCFQCSVILQLAEKGACVIVGRNADYILKDRPDALHTFIFADMAFRADRIVRLYGESDKSPEARLNEKDKRRRVNYQHYTGRTWGQSQNYDICLNSGVLGIDQCADIIVENSKK